MRPRDEGGSSLVGTTAPLVLEKEEEISAVEGTVDVLVALLKEVEKSLALPSSSMVVEEGVLMGSSVGVSLGNVLVVAEGFPAWFSLLDPSWCSSISCWCPQAFQSCASRLMEVDWLRSCSKLQDRLRSTAAPQTILINQVEVK